ncbi:hypothetical protein CDL12_12947 [Handroanthus impetiginosus]|uniref:Uncharacterized protein n=1 Tax=Handroanthus impetiginosus TaxID=429701 RepID=A0A2G9HA80_9LAMI|nr:hypothetical protein CDL12_12947 [Handroanthus impetiginosus]
MTSHLSGNGLLNSTIILFSIFFTSSIKELISSITSSTSKKTSCGKTSSPRL